MKPNFGIISTSLRCSSQNGSLVPLSIGYYAKFVGRVLGVGLLFGNVIGQLAISPVLAATCTYMRTGSDGESVRALQKTLNDNGFDAGTVDGIFGQQTRIALLLFQRVNNLDPDGEVGPATCSALVGLAQTEFTAIASPAPSTPPTSGSASSGSTLKRGDQGLEVTVLQNALRSRGYTGLQASGVYDEPTEDTVKAFQFVEGLPVTGEADPTTRARLGSYLNSDNGGATPTPTPTPAPTPTPQPTPAPPDIEFRPPITPTTPPQTPTANNGNGLDYQVVVPVRGNDGLLAEVRAVVSGAIVERTRLGSFVNVGSYAHRYQAESVSYALKARGFDARVVHR